MMVKVHWQDAAGSTGGVWTYADEVGMPDAGPQEAQIESCGFFTKKTTAGIWLSIGRNKFGSYCNSLFIPSGMVIDMKEVK